jgi:hypothetical protein
MATPTAPGRTSGLTRRQQYESLAAQLKADRQSFVSVWQELADYLAPRRIRQSVSDRNKGDRRTQNIIDSTPRTAVRTLGSGMHAGITSPARPWFRLTTPDPDLAELGAVKQWLHLVTNRIHTVFLRSNLYNVLPMLYEDIGVFGTSACALLEDDKDIMRGYAYPVGSYALGLDRRGVATTFMREYELTVRQVVGEFVVVDGNPRNLDWSKASATVKALWDRGEVQAAVPLTWLVTPNDEYDPRRLESKYGMQWRSCHFEQGRSDTQFTSGSQGFLRESGYRMFPVLAPRWSITGEDTYGTDCPGMTALGDVKQLQFMQKKKAKAIDKAIDPPLKADPSLMNQKVSLLPGDLTYVNMTTGAPGLMPLHEVRLEGIRELVQDMADTRQRIDESFFADLFRMLANGQQAQPVTAEEIRARQEEKLIQLGPVLERLNDELLDPLIDRTFDILFAAGAIPEPPEQLQGVHLKVEYISIMAQAQKLVGVVGQDRFVASVIGMAEVFPEVLYKIDAMQVVDGYADKLGADPRHVRSDEDARALMGQAQQAHAAAQQAEALKTGAQAAQALANTPLQGGSTTALDAMVGGAAAL